jgi:hypothetical protein
MSLNAFRLVLSAPLGGVYLSLSGLFAHFGQSCSFFVQIVVLIFSHLPLKTQKCRKKVFQMFAGSAKSTNFASSNEIQHVCKTFGKEMTQ